MIPSFFMRNWRVERFIPRRVPAPRGPEDPFGLVQNCQDMGTFGLFQSFVPSTVLSRDGADIEVLERDL
jgi:hypothetical protein